MDWFIERLTGYAPNLDLVDKKRNQDFFSLLEAQEIIKYTQSNQTFLCDLCDEEHEVDVYIDTKGKLAITCGRQSRNLTDDELKVWSVQRKELAEKIRIELGIQGGAIDESENGTKNFFGLGTVTISGKNLKVFLSFQKKADEYRTFIAQDLHNVHKVQSLVLYANDNIKSSDITTNTIYIPLVSLFSKDFKNHMFDKKKFETSLESIRKVNFSKAGVLEVNNEQVLSFTEADDGYWFFDYLCNKHYGVQCGYQDIADYILGKLNTSLLNRQETAQNYCQDLKSKIKKVWSGIDTIIQKSGKKTYALTDPKEKSERKKRK